MSQYSREDVEKAINLLFQNQIDFISEMLDVYGQKSHEKERERVHLAILKLSKGDKNQLIYYRDIAKSDYRDVLYWAEYNNDKPIKNPYAELLKTK